MPRLAQYVANRVARLGSVTNVPSIFANNVLHSILKLLGSTTSSIFGNELLAYLAVSNIRAQRARTNVPRATCASVTIV